MRYVLETEFAIGETVHFKPSDGDAGIVIAIQFDSTQSFLYRVAWHNKTDQWHFAIELVRDKAETIGWSPTHVESTEEADDE